MLRLLLAASVVAHHTSPFFGTLSLVGGKLAVQAFYVMSGFYMALIIPNKYASPSKFYASRFFRLYPLYITCILLSLFCKLYFGILKSMGSLPLGAKIFIVFTNITSLAQDWIYFISVDKSGYLTFVESVFNTHPKLFDYLLVPQAWSLGIEISFYVLAPFLLRLKTPLLAVVAILSILLRIYLVRHGWNYDPWTYRFFPTELVFFLGGAIGCRLSKYYYRMPQTVSFVSITMLFILTLLKPWTSLVGDYCYLSIFTFVLPCLFIFSKSSLADRQIGNLSYGIYLVHLAIALFISSEFSKFDLAIPKNYFGIFVFCLSVAFAWLFDHFIQDKIDIFRHHFSRVHINPTTVPLGVK